MAPMFESLVKVFVDVLEGYVALGLIFAVPFLWMGLQKVDSEAEGSGLGFRLLILPGVAAFWPMFLYRWARDCEDPPVERNQHRLRAGSDPQTITGVARAPRLQ